MKLATYDDRFTIASICNDPSIRPWAAPEGAPPCDPGCADPPNLALLGEEGCFVLTYLEPSRYMVHTGILPAYRGSRAVEACRQGLHVVFCETDALELETIATANAPHVALFARQMGFRPRFVRRKLWPSGGQLHDMQFMSMTVLDWALSGACREAGRAFHARLHELGAATHGEDNAHDDVLGAAIDMVRAGRADKGVGFYNYWARAAGYQPALIVGRDPLRVDVRDFVITVEEDQFTIQGASHA